MRTYIKELIVGLKSYLKVISFISTQRLWAVLWATIVANALLVFVLFSVFGFTFFQMGDFFIVSLEEVNFIPHWFLKTVSLFLTIILLFYIYRYLALIFLSPLFSYISEKVQYAIAGIEHPLTFQQLVKDVSRGVKIAFRNLLRELLLTFFLLGLSLSGVLAPFVPLAIYIVSAYFFGFAMIDYRSETRGLDSEQSIRLIKRHKGVAAGIGIGFKLFLLIPFVGILLAPLFAIIAGALAMEEIDR